MGTRANTEGRGDHLRVLIANERLDRLDLLATVVEGLGHTVVERSIHVSEVAEATARQRPDVALVGLGKSAEHALNMVSEIVKEAYCPVIAILGTYDAPWVKEAAERGAFAYIVDDKPDELQSAIEFTLRRFAEARSLHAAVARRTEESRLETEANRTRQRSALELHDGVVQSLATAQLAHDMGLEGPSAVALERALDLAKDVVSRSLQDLRKSGLTTAQLIRDSSSLDKR
jgi:AmiR/NasT family two-component response regulator